MHIKYNQPLKSSQKKFYIKKAKNYKQ